MTTFTTEDREYSVQHPWPENPWVGPPEKTPEELWSEKWKNWTYSLRNGAEYYLQGKIEYFFPLTEQIGLDLDYEGCEPPKLSYTIGKTLISNMPSWGTTSISNVPAQLTITPNNPIGELKIGPMNIGLEKKPTWYQRVLYKLLGFNWKSTK